MKELRQFTSARVGLGRTGNSLPTRDLLDFQLAHARARDAVHFPFDSRALAREIQAAGWSPIILKSAARNRTEYLRRPDLGRRLDAASREQLEALQNRFDTVFIIADGLSPLAVHRHATGLLREMSPDPLTPVVIVEQGRVAIGDEIGELLHASLAVVLIGERPGLSSPDSLGVYLTWAPRTGRTDAERNCISNIHPAGLTTGAASGLLRLLMSQARLRQMSGIRARPLLPG
jgi:ethanolamine ammonia-lyase small subunit